MNSIKQAVGGLAFIKPQHIVVGSLLALCICCPMSSLKHSYEGALSLREFSSVFTEWNICVEKEERISLKKL